MMFLHAISNADSLTTRRNLNLIFKSALAIGNYLPKPLTHFLLRNPDYKKQNSNLHLEERKTLMVEQEFNYKHASLLKKQNTHTNILI